MAVRSPMVRPAFSAVDVSPTLARRARVRRSGRLSAKNFTLLMMLLCLLLQRFAIQISGLPMSVAAPLGYVLVFWGLISGSLGVDRRRAGLMLGLCAIGGMALACQMNMPLAIAPRVSIFSFIYFMALTSFAVLTFRETMSEIEFFRTINLCLLIVAIAGILEYIGQFAGVSIFSFSGFVPENYLIEYMYAVVIPTANGIRSNGFFLVEPSVFSQYMAVAIIVEAMYFRRPLWLLAFFVGLIVSISGTGWLILGAFVVQSGLTNGRRGILIAIGVSLAAGVLLFLAELIVPNIVDALLGRNVEFGMQGTSGNERFVTPFVVLQIVLDEAPRTFFTGIGPGAAEQILVSFKYGLNTPVKILLEYGVFGLVVYLALFITADRTRRQLAMLLALLVMLFFTGGYQQFPPVLFSVMLMSTVATLREESTDNFARLTAFATKG
jgi:hypothetical protein